jgi:ubiquitin thioesterase protein OTUB1
MNSSSLVLRTHEDEFSPFLFALEDDPRFMQEGGVVSMRDFCKCMPCQLSGTSSYR